MHPLIRSLVGLAVTAIAVVAGVRPASAHIDPDPKDAPAGSAQNVGFTVEHGCDASATIQLDMRLPDGVTDAVPGPPPGWTADVVRNVVTFVGGPLPADVEATFRVRMTLPMTPDTTIYFPFVQRCEQGEIRWIDIPSDGSGAELDEPAPAMNLTAPLPTTTTRGPPTSPRTSRPPTTTAPTVTVPASATITTAPPTTAAAAATLPVATTATATTAGPLPTSEPPATTVDGGDDDSGSGNVVVAGAAGAAVAVTGLTIWQVRRRRP